MIVFDGLTIGKGAINQDKSFLVPDIPKYIVVRGVQGKF